MLTGTKLVQNASALTFESDGIIIGLVKLLAEFCDDVDWTTFLLSWTFLWTNILSPEFSSPFISKTRTGGKGQPVLFDEQTDSFLLLHADLAAFVHRWMPFRLIDLYFVLGALLTNDPVASLALVFDIYQHLELTWTNLTVLPQFAGVYYLVWLQNVAQISSIWHLL